MRQRDLRKLVVETMMRYRFERAKDLLKPKTSGKRRRRPAGHLSRYAEAEELIRIVQDASTLSKGVTSAMSRFRMKKAEVSNAAE
jgi:hypothetical protein